MATRRADIRRFASAAALTAFLAAPAFAQQPADPVAAAKLNKELAEQKAANEVDTAIAEAAETAKVSKTTAVQRLKAVLSNLDGTGAIGVGSTKRDELVKKLEAKIAALEPAKTGTRPDLDPKGAVVKQGLRQQYDRDVTEAKDVADGLKKYADYKDAGKPDEARFVLAGLTRKYPNNPMLQVAGQQSYTAMQLRADAEYTRQFADAMLKNHRDVMASATPSTGDLQFMDAKKWADLTKRRQDKIKLTEKEEGILKSLETSVNLNFQDRPFEEALQDLSNKINQELFIDKQSLKDAGVDLSRPVSFRGNVSARTALRAILYSNSLTFLVKGEMIQVVTAERAEKELTTRSYYLGDLVMGAGPFGNAVVFGPDLSYQQAVANADTLVKSIKDSIDPRCWKENGGACSVTFHMASMSVVVKASTEVHALMGSGLTASTPTITAPPKK